MLWVSAAAAAATAVASRLGKGVNYVRRREHIDQCYNLLDTNLHFSIAMQMKLREVEPFLLHIFK